MDPTHRSARRGILEPFVARVVDLSSPVDSLGLLAVEVGVHAGGSNQLLHKSLEEGRGLEVDGFRIFVCVWGRDPNSVGGYRLRIGGDIWVRERRKRVFYTYREMMCM